jgi:hypothetical protein
MSLFTGLIEKINCSICKTDQPKEKYVFHPTLNTQMYAFCNDCSDKHLIEKCMVTCSVCKVSKDQSNFQHYRSRFKDNGMRLRVNTNCRECSTKEGKVLAKIKKDNPQPNYLTPCPQCSKIVYEKSEHIPEGVDGTNGPWQCDHDHTDGTFRGYLCKRCNTGTGLIGDSSEYFENAKKFKKSRKK